MAFGFDTLAPDVRAGILRRFPQILGLFAVLSAILFIASGRVDWVWAWLYIGIYVAGAAFNSVVLMRRSPETIAERAKPGFVEPWEKWVGALWALAYFISIPLIAGLDERFGWSGDLPLSVHLIGLVAFVAGFALVSWAMFENAFFATVARLQVERHQTVCTTGPYAIIRHPGYLAAIVQGFAAPLLLGSLWALVPGTAAAILMAIRTALEDRMLLEGLEGYEVYARRVRPRLIPRVW